MTAPIDIDLIVREVLKRLAQMTDGAAPTKTVHSVPSTNGQEKITAPQAPVAPKPQGVLVISDRVVTTAQLQGKLDGIQRVQVVPRAVITPAVRDLLRDRKIELQFVEPAATAAAASGPLLVVGVAETSFSPAAVLRNLSQGGVRLEQLARTGLDVVAAELAEQVRLGGSLGVLVTEQTHAALCLANRHAGVRAAWGGCVKGVEKAKQAIGANVLVVSPKGKSTAELEQMLQAFVRAGVPACPAILQGK